MIDACDVGRVADPARGGELRVPRALHELLHPIKGQSAHASLALDKCNEESTHILAQLEHSILDRVGGFRLPPLYNDPVVACIECRDDTISWELAQNLGFRSGAEDDLASARVEPFDGGLYIADPASDPARVLGADLFEQFFV